MTIDPELYEPYADASGRAIESPEVFVKRMRSTVLPSWPEEVLREWLYRHRGFLFRYAHLAFPRFRFSRETWPLDRVPGREAFREGEFCDSFSNVEERATNPYDWLALFMLERGTWNTPIVVLSNERGEHRDEWDEAPLRAPYQLLEGHRRLSFLVGLRRLRRALPHHEVFVVSIEDAEIP